MKSPLRIRRAACLPVLVASLASAGVAQVPPTSSHHTVVSPDGIQWKQLRPGAEMAVVSGDPNKEGSSFVLRLRYSAKARIPPHWHPQDEHLTILSGTFRLGMGERGEEAAASVLTTGAYAFVAGRMPHYGWADGGTTIQVHGIGPFVINYVNPEDDPNTARKK